MQQVYDLDSDEEAGIRLKLSVALCLGPRDEVFDRHGINPDVVVAMSPQQVGDTQRDEQLLKARQMLSLSGP